MGLACGPGGCQAEPAVVQGSVATGSAEVNPLIASGELRLGSSHLTEEKSMSDPQNTQGTPGPDEEADTASGGAPDDSSPDTDEMLEDETTDDEGKPLENPSGG